MEFLKQIQKGPDAVLGAVQDAGLKLFENPISKASLKGLEALGFKEHNFDGTQPNPKFEDPKSRLEGAMGISKMQHKIQDRMEDPNNKGILDKIKKGDPLGKDAASPISSLFKGLEKPMENALSWLEGLEKNPLFKKMEGANPLLSVMTGFIKKGLAGGKNLNNQDKGKKGEKTNSTAKDKEQGSGKPSGTKDVDEATKLAKAALGILMQAGQLALLAIPGVGLLSSAIGRGLAAGVKGVATQAITKAPGLITKAPSMFPDLKSMGNLAKKAAGTAAGSMKETAQKSQQATDEMTQIHT